MTNVLGWRKVFGVLAPSTNTVVEADFARMRVARSHDAHGPHPHHRR